MVTSSYLSELVTGMVIRELSVYLVPVSEGPLKILLNS